jgi:hypothetical protein
LPYSKLHDLVTTVTSAKYCMWCNRDNTTTKQATSDHCWASFKLCIQPTTLNLNHGSYGIKNYCIGVPQNGITSLSNLMKICQVVQKLIWGGGETDTQTASSSHKLIYIFGKQARKSHLSLYYTRWNGNLWHWWCDKWPYIALTGAIQVFSINC